MAFAKVQEVANAAYFPKWIGAAVAKLIAINPTKEELSKLTGRVFDKEFNYVSDVDVVDIDNNVKKGKQNMLTVWFEVDNQTAAAEEDKKVYVPMKIFLSNSANVKKDGSKLQIVDKWGRFAWCTPEEFKANAIPVYSNGPASISKDYRAALRGEEELIGFIKAALGIRATSERQEDGNYREFTEEELNERKSEFGCYFEPTEIVSLIKGDVKYLKTILEGCNDVKIILGIQHGDNADYQTVYRDVFKKNYTNLGKIEDVINEAKAKGYMKSEEYFVDAHIPNGIVKYEVKPTDMTAKGGSEVNLGKEAASDLPF